MLRKSNLKKLIYAVVCFTFVFQQIGFAQVAAELNIAGYLAGIHSMPIDKFRPLHLRYFSYDLNSDTFKFLFDKGDFAKGLSPKGTVPEEKFKEQSQELLKYFLIGITLPDSKFWVNLRPDSQDQIIEPELEQTDLGKVLLGADLQLKKDTAKYTSPETPEGKVYWNKLYKKAEELFGSEAITIPTLTRPWIVPGEIIVRETQDSSFIYKSTLKVCLEQDHLKDSATYNFKDPRMKALNEYSSQLIRELIIPKLTKEVNISKKYAGLRQVFYSLILSRWFKARYAGKTSFYASLIDSKNLNGLTSKESWSKTTYFKEYQKSFNKGEYNISESVYTPTSAAGGSAFGGGQVIRSYFSGGIELITPAKTAAGFAAIGGYENLSKANNMVPGALQAAGSPVNNEGRGRMDEGRTTGSRPSSPDKSASPDLVDKELSDLRQMVEKGVMSSRQRVEEFLGITFERPSSPEANEEVPSAPQDGSKAREANSPLLNEELAEEAVRLIVESNQESLAKAKINIPLLSSKLSELFLSGEPGSESTIIVRYDESYENVLRQQEKREIELRFSKFNNEKAVFIETNNPVSLSWTISTFSVPELRTIFSRLAQTKESLVSQIRSPGSPVQTTVVKRYSAKRGTNDQQILDEFTDILKLFSERSDNDTIIILERLWLSRVNSASKSKVIGEPGSGENGKKVVEDLMKGLFHEIREAKEIKGYIDPEDPIFSSVTRLLNELRKEYDYIKLAARDNLPIEVFPKKGLSEQDKSELIAQLYAGEIRLFVPGKSSASSPVESVGQLAGSPVSGFASEQVEQANRLTGEQANQKSAGSPATAAGSPVKTGGIDFRVMNIITQPLVASSSPIKLPQLANLAEIDLDKELGELQKMLSAGIIPSGERIKELLAACQQKGEWNKRSSQIISCLVDICRLEEDNVAKTPLEIKEALIIAESVNMGS